jgi:hypothetical protein
MLFSRAAVIFILCTSAALELAAQTESARLRSEAIWQRTSPNAKSLDGPVLYQIIFRSSATPGHLPKISNNFTLADSLISEDVNGIHIGTLLVDSSGMITFANGQNLVTSITAGAGLTGGTITSTGTLALDTNFTDARYAVSSSLTSYLLLSGGIMSGPLQLSGAPTTSLEAASKAYVDAQFQAARNSVGVLAADYEFDETSGTVFADSSGFSNAATSLVGGIAPGAAGHTGKAISFSGGVLQATNVPDSPQVWVEAWLSFSPGPFLGTILKKTGSYTLQLNSGSVTFSVTAANGSCSAQSAPLPFGGFVHAGGWYNGLTVVAEANGKTTEVSCTQGPLIAAGAPLYIGATDSSGTNSFPGTLDEVRIRTVAPPAQPTPPTPTNQYCGSTASTAGKFSFSSSTGYRAAALMCQQTCSSPAATMCLAADMVHSAQLGISLPSGVWYSSGVYVPLTPTSPFVNDCNGWTENVGGTPYDGPSWVTGAPSAATCSTSQPIACCTLK